MYSCFGFVKRVVWGDEGENTPVTVSTQPSVQIDTSHIGTDIVVVKQGKRICGTGGALACVPIVQDKAYFEIKVQSTGLWSVGLATKKYDAQSQLGVSPDSWCLLQDGSLMHDNKKLNQLSVELEEGDVIGLSYDHHELCFYRNGNQLNQSITKLRGTLYPAFYVDDGAILDVLFTSFHHHLPLGFSEILVEQDII